jgi:uncharacterized protein (TIGR03083 family)
MDETIRARPPGQLVARWRESRDRLAVALTEAPASDEVSWFGPSMSPRSIATARLMEAWAHGQEIADSLGFTGPLRASVRADHDRGGAR